MRKADYDIYYNSLEEIEPKHIECMREIEQINLEEEGYAKSKSR